jgi:protein-L-isoaspartate(D-aspartate) O-methyltransferase
MATIVDRLIASGVLKSPLLVEAFRAVSRENFVPSELRELAAELDAPLPIGEGQTVSQPWTVAFMLELLDPRPGQHILDIGAGSGWQTTILAYVVSARENGRNGKGMGRVYAMERVPALCAFGKANVARYDFIERGIVEWFCRDASGGLPERAPFDRIIAAAELRELPQQWREQCASRGIIVAPIRGSIWKFEKKTNGVWEEEEYPGFAFVPFVKNGNEKEEAYGN